MLRLTDFDSHATIVFVEDSRFELSHWQEGTMLIGFQKWKYLRDVFLSYDRMSSSS